MARKKTTPYEPIGVTPESSPVRTSSASNASAAAKGNGKRLASQALDDDEADTEVELELAGPNVLQKRDFFGLSNRATNQLTFWKRHHEQIEEASERYLLEQAVGIAILDKLTKVERKLAKRSPVTAPAAGPSSSAYQAPRPAARNPNTLTEDAVVHEVFLNPSNPSLAAGRNILIQAVFRRLKRNPALLGADGAHLLSKAKKSGRKRVVSSIKKSATRIRSDLKAMLIRAIADTSDNDNDEEGVGRMDLRTLAEAVSKSWNIDVSYDLMCRLAWLRKLAKEKVPVEKAVQAELDVILKLLASEDESDRRKGQDCFSRALTWDLETFGACDDLRDETRGTQEANIEEDIRNANNEDIDDTFIESA
ncbi:hypothetical protein V8E36_009439 [Tilletia maclaganii]